MNASGQHTVEIKQTKDGWHYAKCSCGWRSIATPPAMRDTAVLRGEIHVEART